LFIPWPFSIVVFYFVDFPDYKLAKPRILVSVFLLTVLSLLSISYPFSDVNAIGVKADFNSDGKDDLAIGVPGEDVGSTINGGAVQVLYGSSSGLSSTFIHSRSVLDAG
jgi:hypothetical protein